MSSPSVWREWIEMFDKWANIYNQEKSPSVWREWIEMMLFLFFMFFPP